MLSQPETLRHLIALTLNRGSELPSEVQDFENLLQFLAVYPCSEQTKWLCSQLWRQPEVYFERYQQLLALCTPRHSGPRGGASGRIRRCRRADAGGAGRGTHRLHAAVRDAASCARPDGRLPQRRFFQRHRPVSRHDLPPHELARVRRVHQRGQAEPAQLQP